MKDRCRTTFVIPPDAHGVLEGSGWTFMSSNRIPKNVVDALMTSLSLIKQEGCLRAEEYSGDNATAAVLLDEHGLVEHIRLYAYGGRDVHGELLRALALLEDQTTAEVFSPA